MNTPTVSFAAVKRTVSIEAVLARYGLAEGLELRGANLTGRCPFCKSTSDRAFRASPEKNAWYCFGCKKGGNVLDFVAEREGISLRRAALALDEWFGLGLGEREEQPKPPVATAAAPAAPPASESPGSNVPLTFALKTLDSAHPSLAALGLSESLVQAFGLGFCARGLLKGRVAIPVHNGHGELVAYAGLATDLAESERYLFPPKFRPGLEVFNLNRLRERSPVAQTVYLTPDILGVLRLAGAGFPFPVGLFDGTLSGAQEEALTATLPEDSRLVLVGTGFEMTVFERLARTFSLRNLTSVAAVDAGATEPETAASPLPADTPRPEGGIPCSA